MKFHPWFQLPYWFLHIYKDDLMTSRSKALAKPESSMTPSPCDEMCLLITGINHGLRLQLVIRTSGKIRICIFLASTCKMDHYLAPKSIDSSCVILKIAAILIHRVSHNTLYYVHRNIPRHVKWHENRGSVTKKYLWSRHTNFCKKVTKIWNSCC